MVPDQFLTFLVNYVCDNVIRNGLKSISYTLIYSNSIYTKNENMEHTLEASLIIMADNIRAKNYVSGKNKVLSGGQPD